jgi:ArsR family transcriptional regulator
MNDLVLMGKAFADPSRVRIVLALREKELCVCELCDALRMRQSTLSTHLQVIRKAGLVSARKQGKWMYYAIAPAANQLVSALGEFFSRSLGADATLKQDTKRLGRRLSLRDGNECCVGFGEKKTCCGDAAK